MITRLAKINQWHNQKESKIGRDQTNESVWFSFWNRRDMFCDWKYLKLPQLYWIVKTISSSFSMNFRIDWISDINKSLFDCHTPRQLFMPSVSYQLPMLFITVLKYWIEISIFGRWYGGKESSKLFYFLEFKVWNPDIEL